MFTVLKQKIKDRFFNFFASNYYPQLQYPLVTNMDYLINSSTKKKSKVVYTCLTGNYDNLPLHEYLDYSWDYVCFTDNPNLLKLKHYGAWNIRTLVFSELDNQLNNRWHKTHPHIIFPDYEESIYIDSNISLLTDSVFKQIEEKQKELVIPIHGYDYCVYKEANAIKKLKLDKSGNVDKMVALLKTAGFPENYGLNENCLIYRKHNSETIIRIMDEWWGYIKDYCRRDQLSLVYILWENNIKPVDISIQNIRQDKKNVRFFGHTK